jgi:triphosphatase
MDHRVAPSRSKRSSRPRPALRLVSTHDPQGADENSPSGHKAVKLRFDAGASLDEVAACVISACCDHFAANAPALRLKGDPEAVHQLRVALRRLRAFLSLFTRAAPSAELAKIATDAKSIANTLGPARDWHILQQSLAGAARELSLEESGFAEFLAAIDARRLRAQESARATIVAPATRKFLRELQSCVTRRGWRAETPDLEQPKSGREFAVAQLTRLHRRAIKRSRGLAGASPQRRHEARIALKKLRYAAEFFESFFDAKPARAYVRTLSAVQEQLGEDNDRATAARLLQEIAAADAGGKMAQTFALLSEKHDQSRSSHDAAVKISERRLGKLKPFWG